MRRLSGLGVVRSLGPGRFAATQPPERDAAYDRDQQDHGYYGHSKCHLYGFLKELENYERTNGKGDEKDASGE
jgi:hypothetical protein